MNPDFVFPVTMLAEYGVPVDIMLFFNGYFVDMEKNNADRQRLFEEKELLGSTVKKQDMYIAELEKQLKLLQKTLDLIYRNNLEGD